MYRSRTTTHTLLIPRNPMHYAASAHFSTAQLLCYTRTLPTTTVGYLHPTYYLTHHARISTVGPLRRSSPHVELPERAATAVTHYGYTVSAF